MTTHGHCPIRRVHSNSEGISCEERFQRMLDPTYLNILRKLYIRLENTDINWVITGSLGFALQGVPIHPNDIDIQTDKAGAYEIERCFSDFIVEKVAFSSARRIRSHFGIISIDGVRVEIMGDIQKQLVDGTWEAPVDLNCYKQMVEIKDMQIPVLSLDYELQAYKKLGRLDRAEILRKWLSSRHKASIDE